MDNLQSWAARLCCAAAIAVLAATSVSAAPIRSQSDPCAAPADAAPYTAGPGVDLTATVEDPGPFVVRRFPDEDRPGEFLEFLYDPERETLFTTDGLVVDISGAGAPSPGADCAGETPAP